MAEYDDTTKADALRLYLDNVPMSAIAQRESMPARSTLYRWRDEGVCTEGMPWDEYRSQKEAEAIRDGATENEGEWSTLVEDVNTVLSVTLERMKRGEMSVKPSDLKHLLSVKADVESAQRQHEQGQWKREVGRELIKLLYRAVRQNVDQRTAEAIYSDFMAIGQEEGISLS